MKKATDIYQRGRSSSIVARIVVYSPYKSTGYYDIEIHGLWDMEQDLLARTLRSSINIPNRREDSWNDEHHLCIRQPPHKERDSSHTCRNYDHYFSLFGIAIEMLGLK